MHREVAYSGFFRNSRKFHEKFTVYEVVVRGYDVNHPIKIYYFGVVFTVVQVPEARLAKVPLVLLASRARQLFFLVASVQTLWLSQNMGQLAARLPTRVHTYLYVCGKLDFLLLQLMVAKLHVYYDYAWWVDLGLDPGEFSDPGQFWVGVAGIIA